MESNCSSTIKTPANVSSTTKQSASTNSFPLYKVATENGELLNSQITQSALPNMPLNKDNNSFKCQYQKRKQIIEDAFIKQPQSHDWTIGSEPLNEFNVQFLASLAFPTLFPDGKGDPTNSAVVSDISKMKLNHLLKSSSI